MENVYYDAIHNVLHDQDYRAAKTVALRSMKAQIVRLNTVQHRGALLENGDPDRIVSWNLSVHHYLQSLKRQKARKVDLMYDGDGTPQRSSADLLRPFSTHMRQKYDHMPVTDESIRRMVDCSLKTIPTAAHTITEQSITIEELLHAVQKGKSNKAPGRDGICLEVFKNTWESSKQDMLAVMNNMYNEGVMTEIQKHGIVVCLPKTYCPTKLEEYRPLTVFNTDYKLMGRIIANRLRPCMPYVLQRSWFCGT